MVSTYTTAAKPAASAMPPSSAVAQLAVERHREAPQAQEARHLKPEAGDSFSRLAHLFFFLSFFSSAGNRPPVQQMSTETGLQMLSQQTAPS